MIGEIPIALFNGVGVVGVVLIVGWLMWTGRLVPRTWVDTMRADHERELEDIKHDRGEWRAAHRISEAARAEAVGQVKELLEHARTTDAFIRALPHPQDPQ
jgi:hypothetical protein